jgi:hypothetical protein
MRYGTASIQSYKVFARFLKCTQSRVLSIGEFGARARRRLPGLRQRGEHTKLALAFRQAVALVCRTCRGRALGVCRLNHDRRGKQDGSRCSKDGRVHGNLPPTLSQSADSHCYLDRSSICLAYARARARATLSAAAAASSHLIAFRSRRVLASRTTLKWSLICWRP